mmetsp:Transcript_29185/g.63917  ORF Transcript_29185/g.63917 Transcript_29185/m.63917 type:complete len:226 (+) Transcript_29185:185-862(+)
MRMLESASSRYRKRCMRHSCSKSGSVLTVLSSSANVAFRSPEFTTRTVQLSAATMARPTSSRAWPSASATALRSESTGSSPRDRLIRTPVLYSPSSSLFNCSESRTATSSASSSKTKEASPLAATSATVGWSGTRAGVVPPFREDACRICATLRRSRDSWRTLSFSFSKSLSSGTSAATARMCASATRCARACTAASCALRLASSAAARFSIRDSARSRRSAISA